MTAATWARQYHAGLLTQLEGEANEGWPDLPWPPVRPDPEQVAALRQVATLQLLLMRLYDVMLADERQHREGLSERSLAVWKNTGQPKKAA